MRPHVFIRFGKWEEMLAEPLPRNPELYPVTTAMNHYARAVAHANLGQPEEADKEAGRFEEMCAQIPQDRHFFNNTAHDVLGSALRQAQSEG